MEHAEQRPDRPDHEDPQGRDRRLAQWREVFHELDDEAWERTLEVLRQGQKSDRQLSRELVEQGVLAHVKPDSVRVYLGKIRHVLTGGASRSEDQVETPEDREAEEPVEGRDPLKKLDWLIRIQIPRVRKALRFEGRLRGFRDPQASREIRLLSRLIKSAEKWERRLGIRDQQEAKRPIARGPHVDPAVAHKMAVMYRQLREKQDGEGGGSAPSDGPDPSKAHSEQTVEEMLRNVHRPPE